MLVDDFERIKRLKLIIEADEVLVKIIKSCFKNSYEANDSKDRYFSIEDYSQIIKGKSENCRTFYTDSIELKDPINNERLYVGIKIGKEYPHDYLFKNLEILGKGMVPILVQEIGYLEKCAEEGRGPNLLGVIANHKYNSCGLIMEDYSQHGKIKIELIRNTLVDNGSEDIAIIHTPNGIVEKVYDGKKVVDPKGAFGEYFKRGIKYFQKEARIDIT